jgi:hypothetical protein
MMRLTPQTPGLKGRQVKCANRALARQPARTGDPGHFGLCSLPALEYQVKSAPLADKQKNVLNNAQA